MARLLRVERPCGAQCAHRQELTRLRRDLHDGLGPSLAGIMARADVLAALVNSGDARALLSDLRREASSFLGEMRRVLADRTPAELEEGDLARGVDVLASRMRAASGVSFDVVVDDVSEVSWPCQVAAFWIVKEAVTNVVKHAHASRCVVRISLNDGLTVSIVDNGRGGLAPTGLGLSSMRDRATESGGWCDIDDTGQGISVTAHLPEGWERHDRAA